MSSQLSKVVQENRTALSRNPDNSVATFVVASRAQGGLHRRVSVRGFVLEVDEPPTLGGTDQAPNPVEIALAALATCQEITYHLHAAALGIPLREVSVTIEGDVDLRGFFGVDDAVRPGFKEIRGEVRFDSPASPEQLQQLKSVVDAHCPVLDLFQHATSVKLEVARPTSAELALKLVA